MHRRHLLAMLPWAGATLHLAAAPSAGEHRLVFVLLRGGMDGLWAAPVPGDPAFADARGALGRYDGAPLPLQGPFALHPALSSLHAAWQRGELIQLHAIGLPYVERSHFDAQQLLESGGLRPQQRDDGFLGRALAAGGRRAIALATAVPLALRGAATVDTWAPSRLPDPDTDLLQRVQRLYAGDAPMAAALERARALHGDPMAAGMDAGGGGGASAQVAARAAEFLSAPAGPRVAMLELGGWDAHAGQMSAAYVRRLGELDALLERLRLGLGAHWKRTAVLVVTEFGRTVAVNGTGGSDHGSGGVAWLLGGAVRGGRVLADWPGLAPAQRFEGRDLRATTDLRALLHGVLHEHLQLPRAALDTTVLPGVSAPLRDLFRPPASA